MGNHLELVQTATIELASNKRAITVPPSSDGPALAAPPSTETQLRAVFDEHRHHSHDPRTLTGLAAEIATSTPVSKPLQTASVHKKTDYNNSKPNNLGEIQLSRDRSPSASRPKPLLVGEAYDNAWLKPQRSIQDRADLRTGPRTVEDSS